MANVNFQAVPLNPNPITSQPKHNDCLTPVEECFSEKFVKCVNTREGSCCLVGALCCAVGGVTTAGYGLSSMITTGVATPNSLATTAVGIAMQSCGFLTAGSMFGVGCGQSETLKECQNKMQQVQARYQALVLQQPQPMRDNDSDGYGSGIDE